MRSRGVLDECRHEHRGVTVKVVRAPVARISAAVPARSTQFNETFGSTPSCRVNPKRAFSEKVCFVPS